MAKSRLHDRLTRVQGRVARRLGETLTVIHRKPIRDSRDRSGNYRYEDSGTYEANVRDESGMVVTSSSNQPKPTNHTVQFFEPTISVREEDQLDWGDGITHVVLDVMGLRRTGKDPTHYGVKVRTT